MPRTLLENVWYFFDLDVNRDQQKCRVCEKLVTGSLTRTHNLKRHVFAWHRQLVNGPKDHISQRRRRTTSGMSVNPRARTENHSPEVVVVGEDLAARYTITRKLFHVLVAHTLPLTMIDEPDVREFLMAMRSDYVPPSCHFLLNSILHIEYDQLLSQVLANFAEARSVCLTIDTWMENVNHHYIAIMAYYVSDRNGNLNQAFLERQLFHASVTVEDVSYWLGEVMNKFHIRSKVKYVITQGCQTLKTAVHLLDKHHIPCFLQAVNCIMNDALQQHIMQTVVKVRQAIAFFQQQSIATLKMVNCQGLCFVMDCPNNWASTFRMLEAFNNHKERMSEAYVKLGATDTISTSTWAVIKDSVQVLNDVLTIVQGACREQPLMMSKAKVIAALITQKLKSILMLTTTSESVKQLAKNVCDRFLIQFSYMSHESVSLATLLDPHFKRGGFATYEEYKVAYDYAILHMEKYNNEDRYREQLNDNGTVAPGQDSSFWTEHDQQLLHIDTGSKNILELDGYISEDRIEIKFNPFFWWKRKKACYPKLYKLMQEVSCLPASGMSCANMPLSLSLLECKRRFNISVEDMKKLAFLKYNVHLVRR